MSASEQRAEELLCFVGVISTVGAIHETTWVQHGHRRCVVMCRPNVIDMRFRAWACRRCGFIHQCRHPFSCTIPGCVFRPAHHAHGTANVAGHARGSDEMNHAHGVARAYPPRSFVSSQVLSSVDFIGDPIDSAPHRRIRPAWGYSTTRTSVDTATKRLSPSRGFESVSVSAPAAVPGGVISGTTVKRKGRQDGRTRDNRRTAAHNMTQQCVDDALTSVCPADTDRKFVLSREMRSHIASFMDALWRGCRQAIVDGGHSKMSAQDFVECILSLTAAGFDSTDKLISVKKTPGFLTELTKIKKKSIKRNHFIIIYAINTVSKQVAGGQTLCLEIR